MSLSTLTFIKSIPFSKIDSWFLGICSDELWYMRTVNASPHLLVQFRAPGSQKDDTSQVTSQPHLVMRFKSLRDSQQEKRIMLFVSFVKLVRIKLCHAGL